MYNHFQNDATPNCKKIKKVLLLLGNTMLIANFVVLFREAYGCIRQYKPQEPRCGRYLIGALLVVN